MRPETFTIQCDHAGCGAALEGFLGVVRFTDHRAAQKAMRERGWYYDAKVDLCPEHFPQAAPERVFAGGAFHDPATLGHCGHCGGSGFVEHTTIRAPAVFREKCGGCGGSGLRRRYG